MNKKSILGLFFIICFICSISVVSAHEGMENPIVTYDDLVPGEEISDDVDVKVTVHEHNEVKYVNFTAMHIDTRTVYLNKQDSNPSDGWSVTWDTSNAPNGDYWFTSTAYDVKGLEGKAEMRLTLNNIPKESEIFLDNATISVDKTSSIIASLKDRNSKPLADKNVEFIIGNEKYSTKTTSNGVASIQFSPNEINEYEMIVKFNGDNRYLSSQKSAKLRVVSNINLTAVSINDVYGNHKENILLKANLICPFINDTNYNKKIYFYINGNLVGVNLTDKNGDAQFHYTINETGGSYVYNAVYYNKNNESFTDFAQLIVPQSEIYMTMNAVTYSVDGIFTEGNKFKINFIVNNNGPDSAENTILRYIVPNELKYIESKVSQGKINYNSANRNLTWELGNVSVGSQNLEILFQVLSSGKISLSPKITTPTYDESVDNAVPTRFITVNSYKLKSNSLTKYYSGSEKYKVYLYTKDGKAVAGANIKIVLNKKTYNLKTNDKGFVELSVNLKSGSYNVKVTCNKLSLSNKIVVKPVVITKNISKKKSKITKFTAKILNNKGKVIKNKKITFKVKGKKYTAKTNKKGIATLNLKNLKVGKYVVYTYWGKLAVKNTIKIK